MILNLKENPGLLFFLDAVMVIFVALLIYFALKRENKWLMVIPFFSFGFLAILNIGLFNRFTFLNSELAIHKSLIDLLANASLFGNDKTVQFFSKIYPPGYHYLLYPLYQAGLSLPQLSKILGVTLLLATPLIFYYLGLILYERKSAAFFCGMFACIPYIWDTVYMGLPRSVAFVVFLISLIFVFQYQKTRLLRYLAVVGASMVAALLIHPLTFVYLWIFVFSCLLLQLFSEFSLKELYRFVKGQAFLLVIIFPILAVYLYNQREFLEFSSWGLIAGNSLFSARVPYAQVSYKNALFSAEFILPLILFFYSAGKFYLHKVKDQVSLLQGRLFTLSFLMLLMLAAVLFFDKLFFLKAHRLLPFISSFLYLASVPQIEKIWGRLKLHRFFAVSAIALALIPGMLSVNSTIMHKEIFPYGLPLISDPDNARNVPLKELQAAFEEIYEVAGKVRQQVPDTQIVACPITIGDVLRMYSDKGVTSCWRIGGMVASYKKAGEIFQDQVSYSALLYDNPKELNEKCKAEYFLFEKNKLNQNVPQGFVLLFETKSFVFYKLSPV